MANLEKNTKSSNGRFLGIAIAAQRGESGEQPTSARMKKNMSKVHEGNRHEMAEEKEKPLLRALESLRLSLLDGLQEFDRKYMPFSLLQDCSLGTTRQRDKAFLANKENKGVILPYLAAWLMRGLAMGAGMATASNLERFGLNTAYFQAGFGICLSGCIIISSVLWVGWLGLTFLEE